MTFHTRPRHPVTGRRFRLTARTQAELNAYTHRIDSLRTELRLGMRTTEEIDRELRNLRHGPVTLERATRSYLERPALAPNTKRRVRGYLGTHFKALLAEPISALDAVRLAAWIRELERSLHPTAIGTVWRGLRSVVRHAAEKGWIGACPWGSWRPKLSASPKRAQREATRSLSELERLLWHAAAIDDDAEGLLFRAADLEAKIACAALLGLRQGELGGLRWSDVEWGRPIVVLVARQYDGAPLKGRAQPKRIESIEHLANVLTRHRERQERLRLWSEDGPIFPHPGRSRPHATRPYTGGPVLTSLQLRSAVNRAGLPHAASWSAHSLRDSFVTLEVMSTGGDLVRVASRSRHASLSSFVRYLRAVSRDAAPPAFASLSGLIANADGAAPLLPATHETVPKESASRELPGGQER